MEALDGEGPEGEFQGPSDDEEGQERDAEEEARVEPAAKRRRTTRKPTAWLFVEYDKLSKAAVSLLGCLNKDQTMSIAGPLFARPSPFFILNLERYSKIRNIARQRVVSIHLLINFHVLCQILFFWFIVLSTSHVTRHVEAKHPLFMCLRRRTTSPMLSGSRRRLRRSTTRRWPYFRKRDACPTSFSAESIPVLRKK